LCRPDAAAPSLFTIRFVILALEELLAGADDAAIEAMVRVASPPALLAALAQATGDLSLLRDDLRPEPDRLRDPNGGMSREQRQAARELAAETLRGVRDGRIAAAPTADLTALRAMMEFALGERMSESYFTLLREELALPGEDLRAPSWKKADVDPDRPFRVAVVGAGMSGLVAAHRLRQAGISVVIFEKNEEVGGTWWENRYPGCRVDVPNHLYSYSFAQREDWPQQFSSQAVLLDYFRSCADHLDLRPHIRFRTEVLAAEFLDDSAMWKLTVRNSEGVEETLEVNALVSAVGQLNRPNVPDIPGRDSFAGPAFHSAEWDHSVELAGKRVAVIGTGASGFQLIPELAEQAAELVVFQRTPNWFLPTPQYHDDMTEPMKQLFASVPGYGPWYRLWLFWRLAEGALPAARVDPDWPRDGGSVSARNEELRGLLTLYLESEFADAPELRAHVIPEYPPLAKRILLDNGTWARTMKRDNVHLVTDAIEAITPDGVTTVDGRTHVVDVIVYATGFQASRFLTPMRVIGRAGRDLHEHWDGDARAHLGITVPGFPNFFCLYGPNTNLVANGSIIFFSECTVGYIVECIHLLLTEHKRALDCRVDAYAAYNARIEEGNRQMAWGASTVNSWYKNASGRVTQNWPGTLLEFWEQTRAPDPAEYELL
jgi:4-hydroxyacetophenone monooxygenase